MKRRTFVTGLLSSCSVLASGTLTASGTGISNPLRGREFNLSLEQLPVNYTGKPAIATAINGSVPGPVLHWRQGDEVTIRVTNRLPEDSSIHWHGIILPTGMDGVPGLSFPGIRPGETFEYRFSVNQSGTYWYHSHSGFQEQTGLYGAIVVEPGSGDPDGADRDHVITLSDWTDDDPADIYARLKKVSHYYNVNERTLFDLGRDIRAQGISGTWRDRAMWNTMRMSDSDIADVSGYTYTYLMNGVTPAAGWVGNFRPGERVKLRFINASAMSIFDVRIPGLKMTVVAADGQDVEPVTVDEFRLGTAETYDVVVVPDADIAYTLFAQSIDRSGYARGTLTPSPALVAEVPPMDPAPVLGHGDMGMAHGTHHHGSHDPSTPVEGGAHDHHKHHGPGTSGIAPAGMGSRAVIKHVATEYGPHVDMRAEGPVSGIDDPGIGLRHHQHRYGRDVLKYSQLVNRYPTLDRRDPGREIQLHLTGNMSRYMWSFNGVKFADAEPIFLRYGERVRIHLVNDTMMTHPIHLHGLWSELETGEPERIPRKHTVLVQPGKTVSYLVSADALGRWAYHCHLQYHMLGMMREVRVT
jgi:CopA family copper-resistance protein